MPARRSWVVFFKGGGSGAHTLRRKARKKRKKQVEGGARPRGEEAKKVEVRRLPKLAAPGGGAGAKGGRGGPSDMRLWSWVLRLGLLSAALGCGLAERPRRARRDPRAGRPPRPAAGPATCATRAARGRRASPPPPPPGGAWEAVRVPRRRQQREARGAAEEPSPPSRALYFSGRGEQLRLRADLELPRDAFTLQVWLRAEGGQRSPAVITGRRGRLSGRCTDPASPGARGCLGAGGGLVRGWRVCLCGSRSATGEAAPGASFKTHFAPSAEWALSEGIATSAPGRSAGSAPGGPESAIS